MLGSDPAAALAADPWGLLRRVLDGPLHPGGRAATAALLDRANVDDGTRLVDLGCGEGEAVGAASERGATAVGLDRDPAGTWSGRCGRRAMRGDFEHLPIRDAGVDVALAECVCCLADDPDRALAEARRVLDTHGRLALSAVVVSGSLDDVPAEFQRAFCLVGQRDAEALRNRVSGAGFRIRSMRDHHDDLLAMRDKVRDRVDYERLLGAMGERGETLLSGIQSIDAAVEAEEISYASIVATAD